MTKSPLESTWLYHEIGRCYLELNKYSQAKNYGDQSYTAAVEAEDLMWQLQASVLIAQAEGMSQCLYGSSQLLVRYNSYVNLTEDEGKGIPYSEDLAVLWYSDNTRRYSDN